MNVKGIERGPNLFKAILTASELASSKAFQSLTKSAQRQCKLIYKRVATGEDQIFMAFLDDTLGLVRSTTSKNNTMLQKAGLITIEPTGRVYIREAGRPGAPVLYFPFDKLDDHAYMVSIFDQIEHEQANGLTSTIKNQHFSS